MNFSELLSPLLVFVGAVLMTLSTVTTRQIFRIVEVREVRNKWLWLHRMMAGFVIIYLLAIYILFVRHVPMLEMLVALVFLAGAIFVYLTVRVSVNTLRVSKESDTTFLHMIDEVSDYAIILMSTEGEILSWNRGAKKIKGYNADEIIGKNFTVFYQQKDIKHDKPSMLKELALKHGRAQDEGWRKRKDGKLFWASVTITALHNEKGMVTGFSKVTRDLTERKLAEDAREEHLKSLEAKNNELEQFVYIATHDLQEPLTTITSLTDMLAKSYEKQLDETGQQTIKYIQETTNRMNLFIKGLLDYGRIGKYAEMSVINTNRLLEEVRLDLGSAINKNNATLTIEDLPEIEGYEVELRLLFQNLISNALKFQNPATAPEVIISAITKAKYWQFMVKDNGIGIDPEHLKRIFIIFQRLNERNKYTGTGIGLAHCRKIIELHNGKIWAESVPGEGSTFYFTIKRQV